MPFLPTPFCTFGVVLSFKLICYDETMTINPSIARVLFDGPARYQIRVIGQINESWTDRLEGMAINMGVSDEKKSICTLEGELLDQAALVGVLITLYELHLPVLWVKCLDYPAVI